MDQNSPALVRRLRSLRPEVRRAVLVKACAFSAAALGGVEPLLAELLEAAHSRGELSTEQAAKAASLAETANRRCFELEEQDAPRHEWLKPFSEAHLWTAIAMAFGPDSEDDAAALYELLKSMDHGSGLEQLVEREISAAGSDFLYPPEKSASKLGVAPGTEF